MKSKEGFANNYLIFRSPTNYILILIPSVIGVLINIYFIKSETVTNISDDLILEKQEEMIDAFLNSLKITFLVLLSFIMSYRWSSMQKDGSYGFWITQGVNKYRFFIMTLLKFLIFLYIPAILGLGTIFYLNNLYLSPIDMIILNLLIITHLLFVIGLGVLIANLIGNPETASFSFITLIGLNFVFNRNEGSIWYKLFHSDLQYKQDDAIVSLFLSLILVFLINVLSLRIHITKDIQT